VAEPTAQAVDELVDRRGLIAGGLEIGDEIEVGHERKNTIGTRVSNARSRFLDGSAARPLVPEG
jgi:hypothetical protein